MSFETIFLVFEEKFKDIVNEDIMKSLKDLYKVYYKNKDIFTVTIDMEDAMEVREKRGRIYENLTWFYHSDSEEHDLKKEELGDVLMLREDGSGGFYGYCDKYGIIDFDHESKIEFLNVENVEQFIFELFAEDCEDEDIFENED